MPNLSRFAVLLMVLTLVMPMATYAQDGDDGPQQYVTSNGLVLTIPATWRVTEYGLAGFITITNHTRPSSPDRDPGEITIDLEYEIPTTAEITEPSVTSQELALQATEDFLNAGGETGIIDNLTISDRPVGRMRGSIGDDFVTVYTFFQSNLYIKMRAQTGDSDLDAFEADIFLLIGAMRFDFDPIPATSTPSPAPTNDAHENTDPTPTETTDSPVIWVQNVEITSGENSIGGLDEVVALGDGTLIVSDSFSSATVDVETGRLLDRIAGDPDAYSAFQFLQFGPDFVLYGWDTNGNLVKLRRDLSVIQSLALTGPELAIVRSLAVTERGDLMVYGVSQDSEVLAVLYNTAGQLRGTINLDSVVGNTLFTSAALAVRPDGSLLYVDAQLSSRLLTSSGVIIELDPLEKPPADSGSPAFVAPSLDFDSAGRLYVLSGYGLTVYDTDGSLLTQLSDVMPDSSTERFEGLQMPTRGDVAVVDDNRVVVVGPNEAFSVVTLLDIAVLLGE